VQIGLDRLEMNDALASTSATLELDRGHLPASALQGHLVHPLHGKFASTTMHVSADDDVPFGTVVDVLYTSGHNHVRSWVLAWNGREFPLDPPRFSPTGVQGPDAYRVRWSAYHVGVDRVVADGSAREDWGCISVPRSSEPAERNGFFASIGAEMCEACTPAGCPRLTIVPDPNTRYADAVGLAAAMLDATSGCTIGLTIEAGTVADAPVCPRAD